MANSFDGTLDQLTFTVPDAWRKMCAMPRYVNNDFDPALSEFNKGDTIETYDVNDMDPIDVTPGHFPSSYVDVVTTKRNLTLNYYKEIPFKITNKDLSSINAGVLPRTLIRAIDGLARTIDQSIYTEATKYAYQALGTAGTAPFASNINLLSQASTLLDNAKAPSMDRVLALDPYAMQNARQLTQFSEADKSGTQETLRTGEVNGLVGV